MLAVLILDRVANNFKTPGDLWAPILTSFISPHWYFRAHIFNEMLKAVTKKKTLHGTHWINFHIMFLSATWYGVDPMNSVTLEIVL